MTRADLLNILDTLESVEAELEQLIYDNEWYVTDVLDKLTDSKARIKEALKPQKKKRN